LGNSLLTPNYIFYLVNKIIYKILVSRNEPLLNYLKAHRIIIVPQINPDTYTLLRELVLSDGSEDMDQEFIASYVKNR